MRRGGKAPAHRRAATAAVTGAAERPRNRVAWGRGCLHRARVARLRGQWALTAEVLEKAQQGPRKSQVV